MSLWSRVKSGASGLLSATLGLLASKKDEPPVAKQRIHLRADTPADVRAAFEADPNVVVVDDVPLPTNAISHLEALALGLIPEEHWQLPGKLRGNGYVHNETFDVGINRAKRAIKAIKNKRERKAARSRFIQRLRDSGIKS